MFRKSNLEKAQAELKKARTRLSEIGQRSIELEKAISEANISAHDARMLPGEFDAASSIADVQAMSEELVSRSMRAREVATTLELVRGRVGSQLVEAIASALNLEHSCAALRLEEVDRAFSEAAEILRKALRPALNQFAELSKIRCTLDSRLVGRSPGEAHAEATVGQKPNWLRPVNQLLFEEVERVAANAEQRAAGIDDDYIFEISHDDRSAADATGQRGSIQPADLARRIDERQRRKAYFDKNIKVQEPDPQDAYSYWVACAEAAKRAVADARGRLEFAGGRARRTMLEGILRGAENRLSNATEIAQKWKAKLSDRNKCPPSGASA